MITLETRLDVLNDTLKRLQSINNPSFFDRQRKQEIRLERDLVAAELAKREEDKLAFQREASEIGTTQRTDEGDRFKKIALALGIGAILLG